MKQKIEMRTNPERLAEILYEAIKRYIDSKNGNKSLDFQPCKSGNSHRFRDMGKENHILSPGFKATVSDRFLCDIIK